VEKINNEAEDVKNWEHLAERCDTLQKEVQALEQDKFLLIRQVREGEALTDLRERNSALMLETQQSMLKDVTESKIACENDLKHIRAELDDKKVQFETSNSNLKKIKIVNKKLRQTNLKQLQQVEKLEQRAKHCENNHHKKISMLTNKLEGANADLLRSKRLHTEAKEAYKELELKYNLCIEKKHKMEALEKELVVVKAELQRLKESNKIEWFQAQLKNLETENFELKNRLNDVWMINNSSSTLQTEKNRRAQAEVELSTSKEKYNVAVKALNKEAQSKMKDLHKRYDFFRKQIFAIYKVLQHNDSYLSVHRPEIHNAYKTLKIALKNQVKAMGSNKMSLDC